MTEIARLESTLGELDAVHAEQTRTQQRHAQLLSKMRDRLNRLRDRNRIPTLHGTPQEWTDALLRQAKLDLRAAASLQEHELASVRAMLLQMAFEKIAKAHLAKTNWPSFENLRHSHAVASRLAVTLRSTAKDFLREAKYRGKTGKEALSTMVELTKAHPALEKDGPHLEYPWSRPDGLHHPDEVRIVTELSDPHSIRNLHLLKFAQALLEYVQALAEP